MRINKKPNNKLLKRCIGLRRDACRDEILKFSSGAEETSSEIKFIKNGWVYFFFFEQDICKESGARLVEYNAN